MRDTCEVPECMAPPTTGDTRCLTHGGTEPARQTIEPGLHRCAYIYAAGTERCLEYAVHGSPFCPWHGRRRPAKLPTWTLWLRRWRPFR